MLPSLRTIGLRRKPLSWLWGLGFSVANVDVVARWSVFMCVSGSVSDASSSEGTNTGPCKDLGRASPHPRLPPGPWDSKAWTPEDRICWTLNYFRSPL